MAHEEDMVIFFPRFGEANVPLPPTSSLGAPVGFALAQSSKECALAHPRVEDGKVTSSKVKQPWSGLRISSVHTHTSPSLA